MAGISAADSRLIIDHFEDIVRRIKRKADRPGTQLRVLSARVARAFPGDRLFRMLDVMGDFLGRRTDALTLSTGSHGTLRPALSDLNKGAATWLTAFYGPAQGTRIGRELVAEIETAAADFILESHHVVEVRVRRFYANDLAAYVATPGQPPDADRMVAIAIPAGLHRGARYYPLELKSPRLRQLREALPDRDYNLTDRLLEEFPDSYLSTVPFPAYLQQLSQFYKAELPELYREVALPGGQMGGIRAALLRIADDTGQPRNIIASNL